MMDLVRSELVLILACVAAVAYLWLWLSAGNKRSPISRPQEHSADDLPGEEKHNRARQPLEILYPTDDANKETEVDIIAVHGLGSNVDWSWVYKDGNKRINWLGDPDMLSAKVPKARIIVYNYESKWHADAPKTRLQLCGEELMHSVHSFRDGGCSRPIIFVGHSLGGNVIVHGLLHAGSEDKLKYLPKMTVGLVFLGTPFRGTKWQPFVDSIAWLTQQAGSHRGIIRELGFDEPTLQDKLHSFCRLRNRLSIPVSCFSELYETDYGRRVGIVGAAKGMVVEEASACIPGLDRYALQTDHLKINKYYGPTDRSFLIVSATISEMCANAKDTVHLRNHPSPIITNRTYVSREKPEARDCLRDLFLTDPSEDRKALKRKKGDRARGTCEWVLGTEQLTTWLGSGQTACSESQATDVLWLHGNPGTGKSIMSIFLTEELSTAFSATDGKTLAYFFCDSSFDKRKTASSIIRGLLLQLVQQHPQLLDYLLLKYNERGAELFKSFDALWTIFMAAAEDQNTGRKYCIIDALDECDQESQQVLLRQFQETFQSRDAPSNIRILVTSRPYPEIHEYLEEFANKDLASFPEAKQDIDRCIEEKVAYLAKRKHYTDKVKQQVSNILRDKAEGTFLWVGLACEELEKVSSKDAIQILQSMPRGLHSLYKRLLDTAREGSGADIVRRMLSLVAVCVRPLSVLELSEACQLYEEEVDVETRVQFTRDQIASCRLMIIIQDEKVLLLHQSVKDYLVGDGSNYFIDKLEAHANAAYRCIDVLIDQFHSKRQPHEKFSAYATKDWPNHARMAQWKFEVRESQAEFFEIKSRCREQWLEQLRSDTFEKIPQEFSILHIAGRWGVPALVDFVYGSSDQEYDLEKLIYFIDIDCVDASYSTPLEQAALSGYLNVLPTLLKQKGKVTEQVLEAAAGNSNNGKEVMALLLDRKGDQITITEEVVEAAAGNSENGKEVMELLLDRKGDQITMTEEVVKAAARNSRNGKEVMALLLDRKGDQMTITEEAVSTIAEMFDEKVMALLLDRKGDQITITEEVVEAAAGNWTNGKEVMELLLDRKGDQITITEEVVEAAAGNSRNGKEVMALLLDRRGDQITITEEVAKAAAGNLWNAKEVMALLLNRRGDEITITEEVIKAAAGNEGNGKEVMTLLLDRKGDQLTITEEVVKAAATCGQDEVLTLLSQQSGLVSVQEEWRFIAKFYNAAKAGDIQCINQLLCEGTKPDTKNTKGVTPLWIAAALGHEAVVEVLATRSDVDVNSMAISRRSPLFWPSTCGYERVVLILMDAGANPHLVDENGDTAIIVARQNGHARVAKILERVGGYTRA